MKYLIVPLVALAIILGLTLAPTVQERWQQHNSYQAQIEALDLARRESQLQDWQAQQSATAASRALVGNMGYLGAGLASILVLMFLVDYYRQRRAPLARFGGELVARNLIEQADPALISLLADRIHAAGIAQIEAARNTGVPTHYAPHLIQRAPDLLPEVEPPAAPIAVIKPMAEWLGWIDQQPHALLGGKTKAGKTWLATALLERRLRAREQVFIIDPHSSGWLGLPGAGSVANDGELGRALGAVLGEYIRRMQARDQHKKETDQELPHDYWPRLTVLIDEANAIADEYGVQWKTIIKQLASGSRKVGISLLCLAQSPLVEDLNISGAMRENFARIGLDERSVLQLIDSERDKDRKAALRHAIIGMDRPAAAQIGAQVWLLDRRGLDAGTAPAGARSQVWAGWDFANGRRAAVATIGNAETLKQKVSASETDGNEFQEFQITPEIAQIVRRLRNEGKSKVQTIYLVWGAKPGGSKSFRDASQVYDTIVGESVDRAA